MVFPQTLCLGCASDNRWCISNDDSKEQLDKQKAECKDTKIRMGTAGKLCQSLYYSEQQHVVRHTL
jgi:hypothetical protein